MTGSAFWPSQKLRIAAIDVGSNSIHMSVFEIDSQGRFKVLRTEKDQTRLGSALDERQCFGQGTLTKVSNVLTRMKQVADSYKAQIRAVGTHALREAKNGTEFCTKLQKRCGVQVEIISGHEEARLVYLGVQKDLELKNKPTLVCDIGGGSVELLVGQWGEESFAASLKLGCVHLTKEYLRSDPLVPSELNALDNYIHSRLEPVLNELRRVGFAQAVGTSGTVKAVKAVSLGLKRANQPKSFHGHTLTAADVAKVKSSLFEARTVRERKLIPSLDSKRADVIVAGVAVLDAITQVAGVDKWTISLSAIREGVALDSLMRKSLWLSGDPNDVRWRAVRAFGKKLHVDEAHAWHISSLAVGLFEQLKSRHNLPPAWREYLRAAAYLHECGLFLGYTGYHKHGYYMIRNSGMFGFTIRELDFVSLIVRFHRKRLTRREDNIHKELDSSEVKGIELCAAILRLSAALDRRKEGRIQEIKLREVGKKCYMEFFLRGTSDISLELYEVGLEKKIFEKAFNLQVEMGGAHVRFSNI